METHKNIEISVSDRSTDRLAEFTVYFHCIDWQEKTTRKLTCHRLTKTGDCRAVGGKEP